MSTPPSSVVASRRGPNISSKMLRFECYWIGGPSFVLMLVHSYFSFVLSDFACSPVHVGTPGSHSLYTTVLNRSRFQFFIPSELPSIFHSFITNQDKTLFLHHSRSETLLLLPLFVVLLRHLPETVHAQIVGRGQKLGCIHIYITVSCFLLEYYS